MPRRSLHDQVAVSLLSELAMAPQISQSRLEALLGATRETVSRKLNTLEALGLVKRLNVDGGDGRLNTWRSSLTGLIAVHSWLVHEDAKHPDIERIADAHGGDWLVYARYGFLKENPDVLSAVNSYVYIHHPYVTWRSRDGFARTYESIADSIKSLRTQPNQMTRETRGNVSLELDQASVNAFTRKVLGWDQFIESIVYSHWMMAFIVYLLQDKAIRDFFADQLLVEDKRYALIHEFRRSFFPETVKTQ